MIHRFIHFFFDFVIQEIDTEIESYKVNEYYSKYLAMC